MLLVNGSNDSLFDLSLSINNTIYRSEEFQMNKYNKKTDIYSLGIILLEMLLICKTNFEKCKKIIEIKKYVNENNTKKIPYLITNDYDVLLYNILCDDYDVRFDINEIIIFLSNRLEICPNNVHK